jgi:serine/threonine-protein kinase ATR
MAIMLPYFDQIAPFLILRMCTQPELLVEACRIMYVVPEDFIATTLPRTLPHLFGACEVRIIETIGKTLKTKPSTLFLNHSADILAHLFLLRSTGQTDKAMACLLNVLTDSANQKGIDTHSVVKSAIVQLTAQLVIVMGDENPDVAASVSHCCYDACPQNL